MSAQACQHCSTQADLAPSFWVRVCLACVLAGQGMAFGMGLNIAEPKPAPFSIGYLIVHGGLLLSSVLVFCLLGGALVKEFLLALAKGRVTVEALFLLSLSGAFVGSVISTLTGQGSVYYEVVAILLVIYRIGHALGARARRKALQSLEALQETYSTARVIDAGADAGSVTENVPLKNLNINDINDINDIHNIHHENNAGNAPPVYVQVRAGEAFTVDGEITEGTGYIQRQTLTGEPQPVRLGPGSHVQAGSYALDCTFTCRAVAGLGHRAIDGIFTTLQTARAHPSALQTLAESRMRFFVPIVLLASMGTFCVWWAVLGALWHVALFNAMAVLIVACPCALGLATPMGVWGGLNSLVTLGITARSGELIERLATARAIIFDKTGTLTEESLALKTWHFAGNFKEDAAAQKALQLAAAALEAHSPHPLAKAVTSAVESVYGAKHIAQVPIANVQVHSGLGIAGRVQLEGRMQSIRIGSAAFVRGSFNNHALNNENENNKNDAPDERVHISVEGVLAATLTFEETLRPGALAAVEALRARGVQLHILTGDSAPAWSSLAGVQVEAALSPQDKVARTQAILHANGGHVLFVGDGLNDAGAMAQCPGALAFKHAPSVVRAAALGEITQASLACLPAAHALAQRIRRSILSNMQFAFVYNFFGMGLAACGYIHPILAALLMTGNSLLVSTRALRASQLRD